MWHNIKTVAENNCLDADKLIEFALQNENKYSIIMEQKIPKVSTWHSDKLVHDFKIENGISSEYYYTT